MDSSSQSSISMLNNIRRKIRLINTKISSHVKIGGIKFDKFDDKVIQKEIDRLNNISSNFEHNLEVWRNNTDTSDIDSLSEAFEKLQDEVMELEINLANRKPNFFKRISILVTSFSKYILGSIANAPKLIGYRRDDG